MRRYGYDPRGGAVFGAGLGGAVLLLLAWNVIAYLLQMVLRPHAGVLTEIGVIPWMSYYLGLRPAAVLEQGWIWQLATYMFLHGSLPHILFNMLALWMFGSQIEADWGTPEFVRYYFFTGIGAGITNTLIFPGQIVPTVGASGAIYGLLLAYGVCYPNREIYLYFLFPIKAKYFVILFGAIELVAGISGSRSGIAHFAHLGGLLFGLIYLWMWGFPGGRLGFLRRRRIARRRAPFQVIDFTGRRDRERW